MRLRSAGPGPILLALSLLTLAAPEASADPRWWWNDSLVASSRDISFLDIDVVPSALAGEPPAIFVSWLDPPGMTARPLYLAASFDGGCTFCTVEVTDVYDVVPEAALAVAPLRDSGRYSIQILYTDRFEMKLAYDVLSVPLAGTAAEKCAALSNVATNRVLLDLSPESGSALDMAVAWQDPFPPHFHAVWRRRVAADEYEVFYARDLAGDGSGWEVVGSLTDTIPPSQSVTDPRVSADVFHGGVDGTSAVNVVFRDEQTGGVLHLRSTDSGNTFSATGAPPAGPPGVLNDPASGQAVGPIALDSGAAPSPQPLWHGVLWCQSMGPSVGMVFDAQYQDGPTTSGPPWQDPDAAVDAAGLQGEGGPALSVFPSRAGEPTRVFLVWIDVGSGAQDLHYRGGLLDSGFVDPIGLDFEPFPLQRPTDPVVSTNRLLTACAWDEITGDCLSERTAGRATQVAMDEEDGELFTVWRDDRAGRAEVWFKRTDRSVEPPSISLEGSCPTPDTRRITVTWPQVPTCRSVPVARERIARYLVHWGRDPGGPYDDRIVADDDGTLPDPVQVDIDGLEADTTYCVIVVPEDEARNVWPPGFHPMADLPASPRNEVCYTTPADCGQGCGPFSFGGPTLAVAGECFIDVSWDAATGEAPVLYEVSRDGTPVVSGLTATAWRDDDPVWGFRHMYQVRARDACADPGPREGLSSTSALTAAEDLTPPDITEPVLTMVDACTVRIEAEVTDVCSGPATEVDITVNAVEIATGVPLPYDHTVTGDGRLDYLVRGYDEAGNQGASPFAVIVVDGCSRQLHRKTCATRDTSGIFTTRETGTEVAFTDPERWTPHRGIFHPGDPDPDPVLAPGAPVLIFYQVAEETSVPWVRDLRVVADREAQTVRIFF